MAHGVESVKIVVCRFNVHTLMALRNLGDGTLCFGCAECNHPQRGVASKWPCHWYKKSLKLWSVFCW